MHGCLYGKRMKPENRMIVLSPAQQKAFDAVMEGVAAGHLVLLKARSCSGRTTVLQKVQAAIGGVLLGMREFPGVPVVEEPFAFEEFFLRVIEQALASSGLVIVDDLHLVTQVTRNRDYPHAILLDAALTAMLGDAAAFGKKMVFATDQEAPWPIERRAVEVEIG